MHQSSVLAVLTAVLSGTLSFAQAADDAAGVVTLGDTPPPQLTGPDHVFPLEWNAARTNPYAAHRFAQPGGQPIQQASWQQPHASYAPMGGGCPPGAYGGGPMIPPGCDVCAEDRWYSYVEMQATFTNSRDLGDFTLFLPLLQDGESMVYADFRGQWDSDEHYEGSIGGGVRRMMDEGYILGMYGFYDSRWTNDNHFNQATMGIEALAVGWEVRMNGYLPDTNARSVNTPIAASAPFGRLVNDQIFVVTETPGNIADIEAAMYGLDWEVGTQLGAWGDGQQFDWRAYAGGYFFDSNEIPDEIAGPRLRTELRVWGLPIGDQSRLVVGGTYQWDRVRNDQYIGYVQVRIPLGGATSAPRLDPLERRMLERVVRDPDVVVATTRKVTPKAEFLEPATFDDNGRTAFFHAIVDGNTTDPATTVATPGAGSNILFDGNNGNINATTPILVQNGQFVVGTGQTLAITGTQTGTQVNFTLPGPRPTIAGTSTTSDVIVVAANADIRGLDVTGGRSGFSSDDDGVGFQTLANTSNLRLIDNTSTNAADDAFAFNDIDANTRIVNNTATNAGEDGFQFNDVFGTVTGNTATGSTFDGFDIFDNFGTISGNTANGNGNHGMCILDNSGTYANNVTNNNTVDGINALANSGTFTGNTATGNGDDGFQFTDNTGTFTGNTASNNGDDGFTIPTNSAGGNFSNNVANNNGGGGYDNGAGALPTNTGTAVNNFGTGNAANNTFP